MPRSVKFVGTVCLLLSVSPMAMAAVSSDDAAALKSGKLTPMGGEKAGNADGSIPAWTGGIIDPNYKPENGRRDNLFKGDKPLFSITAANLNQYTDKVSESDKMLFSKFPQTYRMDVYKTIRSSNASQWVYDNTYKNALNGKLEQTDNGPLPRGVFGGVPFPIPKSGEEVMWNHLLTWRGTSWNFQQESILVTADGQRVLISNGTNYEQQTPYYYPTSSVERFEAAGGLYAAAMLVNDGPPVRAGDGIVALTYTDSTKDKAWVYLTGQRRVRMLPNVSYDTPVPSTAGIMNFDEVYVFYGRMDRFDWNIVGKTEIYIPYNDNQFLAPHTSEEAVSGHHLNPDHVRWELHRVWVVDAKLKPGKRNVANKSRYYIDEDSWRAVLADRYDSSGQLWRHIWQLSYSMPDLPAVGGQTFGFYDLISGAWFSAGLHQSEKEQLPVRPIREDSYFTPENLASVGIR